jgi:hypothetical protein
MALSDYLTDAAALLHDNNMLFTSKAQLIRWINSARKQIAERTGCIEKVIMGQSAFGAGAQPGSFIPGAGTPGALPGSQPNAPNSQTQNLFFTIPGVERYPYQDFANPFLTAQHEGCLGVIDTISVSVNWGGSPRPSLAWMPWQDLQAYGRAYATLTESYPYFWSTLNDGSNGEVWLFPVPSFPNEMEWQVICTPKPLYTDNDFDIIPANFREAVKYYAAGLAFMGSRRYADGNLMMGEFQERIGVSRASSDSGKVPNFYWNP